MLSHFARKVRSLASPAAPTLFARGYHWHATEAGRALLADPRAGFDPFGGVVVKENGQRTIRRVETGAGAVYVKVCRVNTPRTFARELLRPAKARLEFENAVELRRLGVETVEPLAWGARSRLWPGVSVLVTREQPGALPLTEYLEALPASPVARRRAALALAEALARLHDLGIDHPDPHPGNFLVGAAGAPVTLMDLHAVRFARPLDWPATLRALTLWNRWFQPRAPATDRLRFWLAYLAARPTLSVDCRGAARQLERATAASNRRFWTARLARYVSDNRDTHRISAPGVTGYAERDLPPDFVAAMLADPDAVFARAGNPLIKDSPSSTVAEVRLDGRSVIVKRFRVKSAGVAVKNALRPTPALRSWLFGRNLLDRGLPTARPRLLVERRRYGSPREGYLVFEKVPDALELPEAVRAACRSPERRTILAAWAERLGVTLRRMHDREVSHRDLKAPNILMRGVGDLASATPVLIDLVGVEVGRVVPERVRVRDLARLNASFLDSPLSRADRLRLLRAYLRPDRATRGPGWKRWWRAIAAATAAKVAKNRRSGRPLA